MKKKQTITIKPDKKKIHRNDELIRHMLLKRKPKTHRDKERKSDRRKTKEELRSLKRKKDTGDSKKEKNKKKP